jgi:hypothetical protein
LTDVALGRIGMVAIGRNEGSRLAECLASIGEVPLAVYVDSASTDGSPDLARALGFEVVELETGPAFTAARARDAGLRRLLAIAPRLEFVMFLDGDCTLAVGWIGRAVAELDADPGLAVVCGRRREREPGRSAFRRLIDVEWDSPIGETSSCGGDAAFRVRPYLDAGGYDPGLPVGEEPELCHRLLAGGWRILRVDAEMSVHDLGEATAVAWWDRNVRQGYGALDVARRFPGPAGPYRRRILSAWAWGIGLPWAAASAAVFGPAASGVSPTACGLAVLLAYPIQVLRLSLAIRPRTPDARTALGFAVANLAAKWAHLAGQAIYLGEMMAGWPPRLIEYRSSRR